MGKLNGAENWAELGRLNAVAGEFKELKAKLGVNVDKPIEGYFGNTMSIQDLTGKIVELVQYRPDHSLRAWRDGLWTEGKWLINAGQDCSTVGHTFDVQGRPATFCHAFAPFKAVGDRWISPETPGGHPAYPVSCGGIPVITVDGRDVVEGTSLSPGAMIALHLGLLEAPSEDAERGLAGQVQLQTVGAKADAGMAGYFGNTMMFRDLAGVIIEVIYYRPDHTMRSWRDGMWVEGEWLINNGQDNSIIMQSRDMFGHKASWCHAFSPFKQVGDRWIAPETRGGHPPYPIVLGGIPVERAGGQNFVVGTSWVPELVMSLVPGLVSPE
jgi:hypothetical protein